MDKNKESNELERRKNFIELWYHKTPVVRVETTERGDIITLNSGGYKTVTTKARINDFFRYSSHHNISVSQRDRAWYTWNGLDDEEEWVGDTFVIDKREPILTDGTTHEAVIKTMTERLSI